jgi:hypothetical protein
MFESEKTELKDRGAELQDELIKKITRLIIGSGLPPDEIDDNLIAIAKRTIATERLEIEKDSWSKKFSQLISRLIRRGLAEAAGMPEAEFRSYFQSLRSAFIEHAIKTAPGEIAPIVVIPENFVSLPKQASLTLIDNEKISNNLDLTWLRTVGYATPAVPYLLIGVSIEPTGSTKNALSEINRHTGLTAIEGLALSGQYPAAIKKRNVILAGSDYDESRTPNVILLNQQRIILDYIRQNTKYDNLYLAQCQERITQ